MDRKEIKHKKSQYLRLFHAQQIKNNNSSGFGKVNRSLEEAHVYLCVNKPS